MWTTQNRGRYDRSKLRYPSDLTDAEWALVEPLIPPAKRGGNKRTVNVREIVNGLMYVLGTGCQWAALPKDLPPRSTVNRYLRTLRRLLRRQRLDSARRSHGCFRQAREATGIMSQGATPVLSGRAGLTFHASHSVSWPARNGLE